MCFLCGFVFVDWLLLLSSLLFLCLGLLYFGLVGFLGCCSFALCLLVFLLDLEILFFFLLVMSVLFYFLLIVLFNLIVVPLVVIILLIGMACSILVIMLVLQPSFLHLC